MTDYTGFGSSAPPGAAQINDVNSGINLGSRFHVDTTGLSATKIRFYIPSGPNGIPPSTGYIGALFTSTSGGAGTVIAQANFAAITLDAWNEVAITPQALTQGTDYYAVVHFPGGLYGAVPNKFTSQVSASPIIFPANSVATLNGTYNYNVALTAPDSEFNQTWYLVDVTVSSGGTTQTGTGTLTISAAFTGAAAATRTSTGTLAVVNSSSATATATRLTGGPLNVAAALTGTASGPVAASGGGGWYSLVGIVADRWQQRRSEGSRRPVACYDDGQPLQPGPNGELFCRFCGRQYQGRTQLDYDT